MNNKYCFPDIQEYQQLEELIGLAALAKAGIAEGNKHIQIGKDFLKQTMCLEEREKILESIQKLQQHVFVCENTLEFFQSEIKQLNYLLN